MSLRRKLTDHAASVRFHDRADAGRRLGDWLREQPPFAAGAERPVVLGLPRGGVPVAHEVAVALGGELDVLIVRKLGVPGRPELAMGALGEGDVVVCHDELVGALGIDQADFDAVLASERLELARRVQRYRAGASLRPLAGRDVLIVDDGIATGATVEAACQVARAQAPAALTVATPVAAPNAADRLAGDADSVAVLASPSAFAGVGQFYRDFTQTTDDEVVRLLAR